MITLTRGDTLKLKFQRKNSEGSIITTLPSKMFITFKNNEHETAPLFQKTLEEGITYNQNTHYYEFTIEPTNTNKLPYGEYVFDIEIITDNGTKTILVDKLILTQEVTFSANEE